MDRSSVSGIERGKHNVPLDTVCRLAWALGLDVRELLTMPAARRKKQG
jgi:hypothetical protein